MEKSRFGRVRESKRQGVRRWLGDGLRLDLVLMEVSVYSVDRQVGWCLALRRGWRLLSMTLFEVSLRVGAYRIKGGWMWRGRWWVQC